MNNKQITLITCGVLLICFTLLAGCPAYNVYSSRMQGEAQLAHAKASKEVQVAEAKAKMESAMYEAMADTTRAHGVARSNQIIGQSLINNPMYLQYLWVSELSKQKNVIYIPTGQDHMPVMEATRLNQLKEEEVKTTE